MSGITSLFSDPQQQAANNAQQAAQQQDAFTEQLYQQAQQDRQNQEAQLRGAVSNLAALGNPFATAAGNMNPQFMSPSTNAASFSGGHIPDTTNQAPAPPPPMVTPNPGGPRINPTDGQQPPPKPPMPHPSPRPNPRAMNYGAQPL